MPLYSTTFSGDCDAKSVGGISHIGVIAIAVWGPYMPAVVPPRPGADHVRGTLAFQPRRAICWCALVSSVPAILYPLIDPATHVMQSKWICCEATNLDRLLR